MGPKFTCLTRSAFSTEYGFLGASIGRPKDDKAWNYVRPAPPMLKNIFRRPVSEGAFEFIFLKDYPGRVVSNSNDPPESFHSKDIFTPHSSIPGAWKYLCRLDDRVTLVNGEKVLPLPIEGRIRQNALVREAVVFGVSKSIPGLLLFRANIAKDLSNEQYLDKIWPTIEVANRHAESFSTIGRDMVVPLPANVPIATTDKGSIIRAQVYKAFQKEIDDAYTRLDEHHEGTMKLGLPDLKEYLLALGQQTIGPHLKDTHEDLFTLGMNSLQAIQMRGAILRDLHLGGNGKKLSQNVVFEQGNIANLAKRLDDLRFSRSSENEKPIETLKSLISKYSVTASFEPEKAENGHESGRNVIVSRHGLNWSREPCTDRASASHWRHGRPWCTFASPASGAARYRAHLLSCKG